MARGNYIRSFSGFLAEAGTFLSGDPAEIANQKGWTGDNFGWYRDNTGQVVARAIGGKMVVYDGSQQAGTTPMTTDMGNPAITAGQKPAERARTMGLQSNGKGGYMDDSGQVVARTVNGELVFYDDKGGAVTDGAGGQALTQSSPSWVDPDTGLILVPPAQPETPEEKASTPDPIPATPPMGFDLFITQRHKQKKADLQAQREADADIAAQQQEADAPYEGAMKPLKLKLEGIIKVAEESGNSYRMGLAALVTDKMNGNGEKFAAYYNAVAPEQVPELEALIIRQVIGEAKHEYFVDNLMPLADEAFANGNDEVGEQLESMNSSDHLAAQKEIDKMVDDALGIKEIKYKKKIKDSWHGDGGTQFTAEEGVRFYDENNDPDEDKKQELLDAASDVARAYGMKNPKQILDVNWNSAATDDDDDTDKRRSAMDALYTWREKVLPDLPDGVVVANKPMGGSGGKRARIYKIAGFSDVLDDFNGYQVGLVVTDSNGVKRVVPIEPGNTLSENLSLEYLTIHLIENIDLNSYGNVGMVYESLFT